MPETDQQQLFRRQWVRFQPKLYAYIRTLVFNRADAEELLQDVAEVLWRKMDQFQEGTRFDQWAYSVARYVVLSHQKKAVRGKLVFNSTLAQMIADQAAALDNGGSRELEVLEHCLTKLPADDRELVDRRYQVQATNRSVAQTLGRSESSVSRALTRVHRMLLRCVHRALANETAGELP